MLGRGRRPWGGFWRGGEPRWDLISYLAGTASRPRQAPEAVWPETGGKVARTPFTLHTPEAAGSINRKANLIFKQTLPYPLA